MERFKQVRHLRLTFTFLDTTEFKLKERLVDIVFCQHCPLLQRLYINGYHMKTEITNTEFTFYFPSLLYVRVDKLDHYLSVQLLNRYRQLRSFSVEILSHSTSQLPTNSSDMPQ